jgi:predicted helicase
MNNQKLAQVFHFDLYGKRESKYDFLRTNNLNSIKWNKLKPNEPNFFFVPKNFDGFKKYQSGFGLNKIFNLFKMGTATGKDDLFIDFDELSLINKLKLKGINYSNSEIKSYNYRLFDKRIFFYNNEYIQRLRVDLQKNFFNKNIALVSTKILSSKSFFHSFVSTDISDRCLISNKGQEGNYFFPLYLYPDSNTQQSIEQKPERTPNLNTEIVKQIAEKLGLEFLAEKHLTGFQNLSGVNPNPKTFAPIDILDYIYAVLHSPTYRDKYKEFLKIDFPRVPFPKDVKTFWQLVKLGAEIRQIHLLESSVVENYITQYPVDGNNKVGKISFVMDNEVSNKKSKPASIDNANVEGSNRDDISFPQHHLGSNESQQLHEPIAGYGNTVISAMDDIKGKVFINETQYFDSVPKVAWEFFIGGYQPAQKWLKDRKDRVLEFDDILHYQKIIVALSETARIMSEINSIEIEP